ncbi:class I SAM-dependent methyltransferase [Anaerobacillus alkaliphilus]|uniref:class I SAM-dependent methyltransferase n=1 Tax=Anaerobacillus alkaliphilus TaxID=1548597 RepID=UPI001F4F5F3F|nr:SAM-dependent methyltransferase [Anaerobacillus alkaliphilus]
MKEYVIATIQSTEKKMITYAEYINLVLYDTSIGYYMKDQKKLGKDGDFYTSSGVHEVFGRAFAHFFIDLLEKESLPAKICEFGGGDGRFAKAVLDEWDSISDQSLEYVIIETSPYHRNEQRKLIGDNRFYQFASLEEFKDHAGKKFEGIIFSNELLDAFPVHVVEKAGNNLFEVFVAVDDTGNLIEKREKCSEKLEEWLIEYGPKLADKQRIEVPIYMNSWLDSVNHFLEKGFLLTIDYGYTKEEWTFPQRYDGSLRGYYKHQMIKNPLEHPGEMDLTTHIHLDAYEEIVTKMGFEKICEVKQNRFLLMIGMLKFLQENYDPNPFSERSKRNRAIQSLISDTGMSAAFQVFLHGKKIEHGKSYKFLHEDPYKI